MWSAAAMPPLSSRLRAAAWPPHSTSINLQNREKRLLRDLHLADALHPLLPLFLLLEELALAGDVAAVALGEDVLAQRLDGLAGDDAVADGGLQRHLEHLPGDELLHLLDEHLAAGEGLVLVDDQREGVERLAVDEDVHLHELALAIADDVVVEGGVAARDRLQLVEEVED